MVLDLEPGRRGSLETELVTLAARLCFGGARATFVFGRPAPAWMAAALAGLGAATRVLDFRRPAAAALGFSRMMEAARPALVHFHFVRAHSPLVAIARAAGARVIMHDHVAPAAPAPRRAVRSLLERGFERARAAALQGFVDRRIAVFFDDGALRARTGKKARAQALARFALPVWVERIMTEYAALCPALASTARRAA